MVRSDREPRRMGLASANSEASWRTWGGTSGGAEVAMSQSYGYSSRKNKLKNRAIQKSHILMTCTPKEVLSVIKGGGLVCMLLTDRFIDADDRRDFRDTDLSKRLLSMLDRNSFGTRRPIVTSKVNELGKFFELYGAAWSSLSPLHGD